MARAGAVKQGAVTGKKVLIPSPVIYIGVMTFTGVPLLTHTKPFITGGDRTSTWGTRADAKPHTFYIHAG